MMKTDTIRRSLFFVGLSLIISLAMTSCHSRKAQGGEQGSAKVAADTLKLDYARGFRVYTIANGIRLVEISDPSAKQQKEPYRLALIPKGVSAKDVPDEYNVHITVPVKSIIPMSTQYLSHLIALGALDQVTAITSVRHLQNKEVKRRIKNGQIARIGYEGSFDIETVLSVKPDLIFLSPFKKGGYDALKQTGVPLVPILLFKEQTPLGQAEWIKFFALFVGKEKQADEWFNKVRDNYNSLKALAAKADERPTVFSGEQRNGSWFVMGSRSYLAQLLRDAGARYLPENDLSTGGHPIDYESLLKIAAHADYWRLLKGYPGTFSYEALKKMDARSVNFDAFKNHKVVYCNMATSGYHEWASIHPDWLLADYVYAFHPEFLPHHHPRFYAVLPADPSPSSHTAYGK